MITSDPAGLRARPPLSPLRRGLQGSLLAILVAAAPSLAAPVSDRIVAVVNSELIMLSELRAEIKQEDTRLVERYQGADLERRRRQLEYMALTRMIERKLQLQAAKTKGVQISDEEVLRAAKELKSQGERIDENDPKDRNMLREHLTLLRVVDREIKSLIMVSEPEIKQYYETHQTRFLMPDEYEISQILIRRKAIETEEEARARAKAVHASLLAGVDFTDLVLKHSDGLEATKGGRLGYVRQGELLPEIERALSTLEVGAITTPIETSEGWHILRLDDKRPPQYRPFAEVKNEIQDLVLQQKAEDLFQVWMADLKNKAFIEVKF